MKYLISLCLAALMALPALADPPKPSRPTTFRQAVKPQARVILARFVYRPATIHRACFFDRICTPAVQTDPALMALVISQLSAANRAQPVADPNTAAVLAQLTSLNQQIANLALRPATIAPSPQVITVPQAAGLTGLAGDCCQSLKDQLSANQAALLAQAQQNQAALLQTLAQNHSALLAAMDSHRAAILAGQANLLTAIQGRPAPTPVTVPVATVPTTPTTPTPPITVVNVPPATQPYYPPSVTIPTTPPSVTIPTTPPSVTIPTTPPTVTIPTTPPSMTIPVTPPSVTIPVTPPSVKIPVSPPATTIPTTPIPPAVDIPTTPPSTTIPDAAPSTTVNPSRLPVAKYIRLGVLPPVKKPAQKAGVYAI